MNNSAIRDSECDAKRKCGRLVKGVEVRTDDGKDGKDEGKDWRVMQ